MSTSKPHDYMALTILCTACDGSGGVPPESGEYQVPCNECDGMGRYFTDFGWNVYQCIDHMMTYYLWARSRHA
jgi:DnaJ-class molecular chaperone